MIFYELLVWGNTKNKGQKFMTYELGNKLNKNNYSHLIYALLGLWSFLYILKVSMIDSIGGVDAVIGKMIVGIRIIIILIALVDCIQNKVRKKIFIILIGFVCVVVIGYIIAKHWLLFDCFFIAYFFGNRLNYKKVLEIFGTTMLLAMLLVFILDFWGILPTFNYYSSRTGELRTRLGFSSPGVMAECIMALLFIIYMLYFEKHRVLVSIVMIAAAIWCYIYPNSITVAVVLILVLVIRFVIEKINLKYESQKKKILIFSIIITIGITVFLLVLIYTPIVDGLPFFKTYHTVYARLILGRQGFAKYGISLFGTPYKNVADVAATSLSDYFVLDCLYYLLPIRYGIVTTMCFFVAYFIFVKKTLDKQDYSLFSIMAATVIMSIIGSFITMFPMCFVFICANCKELIDITRKNMKRIRFKIKR